MRLTLPIIAIAALSFGCSGPEPDPALADAELSGSVGVLHVEGRAGSSASRTELRAAFARYQGMAGEEVLRLIGSEDVARDVSLEDRPTCTFDDAADPLVGEGADVELLDVGALHLSVRDTETRLRARTFPDLASVIAGVFYAGDAELPEPRPGLDDYRVRADGSALVAPFEVRLPAPVEPAELSLVGADGTGASLGEGQLTEVTRAGALTVEWLQGDPSDRVEVELTAGGVSLTCVSAADEGALLLDQELVEALPADLAARLQVRQVRVMSFDAPGIDMAFARVAVSRTFELSLR